MENDVDTSESVCYTTDTDTPDTQTKGNTMEPLQSYPKPKETHGPNWDALIKKLEDKYTEALFLQHGRITLESALFFAFSCESVTKTSLKYPATSAHGVDGFRVICTNTITVRVASGAMPKVNLFSIEDESHMTLQEFAESNKDLGDYSEYVRRYIKALVNLEQANLAAMTIGNGDNTTLQDAEAKWRGRRNKAMAALNEMFELKSKSVKVDFTPEIAQKVISHLS
jgi:hypothetical protein